MHHPSTFITGYRYGNLRPKRNTIVHCFRTFKAVKDHMLPPGSAFAPVRYWEVTGTFKRDEGGEPGLVIQLQDYKEVFPDQY